VPQHLAATPARSISSGSIARRASSDPEARAPQQPRETRTEDFCGYGAQQKRRLQKRTSVRLRSRKPESSSARPPGPASLDHRRPSPGRARQSLLREARYTCRAHRARRRSRAGRRRALAAASLPFSACGNPPVGTSSPGAAAAIPAPSPAGLPIAAPGRRAQGLAHATREKAPNTERRHRSRRHRERRRRWPSSQAHGDPQAASLGHRILRIARRGDHPQCRSTQRRLPQDWQVHLRGSG
jgi:hypothetical protein